MVSSKPPTARARLVAANTPDPPPGIDKLCKSRSERSRSYGGSPHPSTRASLSTTTDPAQDHCALPSAVTAASRAGSRDVRPVPEDQTARGATYQFRHVRRRPRSRRTGIRRVEQEPSAVYGTAGAGGFGWE